MALLGKGVLTIWNGIAPEAEDEFVAWHVREHIPERVGLPGFLRGRRYVAADGHPKYFNFYETESTDVLSSAAYTARLNAPTEWTRKVVRHFRDTSRTICRVASSVGDGDGGWIETLRLSTRAEPSDFIQSASPLVSEAAAAPGIVAVHLLEGQSESDSGTTAEKALRGQPDEVVAWVLLVEAVDRDSLVRLRGGKLSDARLRESAAVSGIVRGIYSLQFTLAG